MDFETVFTSRRTLQAARVPTAVFEAGAGAPIVFLHGNPDTHALWHEQVRSLAPRYRCIAPDLPGFGASLAPADFDLSVANQGAWLTALVDALGLPKFHLVLHDIGVVFGSAFDAFVPTTRKTVLRWYRAMTLAVALRGWDERLREATRDVPRQVIWGDRDAYAPGSLADRFGAPVHHLDCGHWAMVERPFESTTTLIEQLTSSVQTVLILRQPAESAGRRCGHAKPSTPRPDPCEIGATNGHSRRRSERLRSRGRSL